MWNFGQTDRSSSDLYQKKRRIDLSKKSISGENGMGAVYLRIQLFRDCFYELSWMKRDSSLCCVPIELTIQSEENRR